MRTILRSLSLVLLVAIIAGCGFHLRGTGAATFSVDRIHVSATNAYGEMQRALEAALTEAGATLVDDNAPYSVMLGSERTTRRPVATTQDNSVAEYEIRLEVSFTLTDQGGTTLIPDSLLSVERIYTFDNANLMGNTREESLLVEEMRNDVAAQVIRRIDASVRAPRE